MIPIEEQRAACAEFMGWYIQSKGYEGGMPCQPYYSDAQQEDWGYVRDFKPDDETDFGRSLARMLKWRLRVLGYGYEIRWVSDSELFVCDIYDKSIKARVLAATAHSRTTEGSALVAAAAELQMQRERDKLMSKKEK